MKIQSQQELPRRVQAWVEAARKLDQSPADRDPDLDEVRWDGPRPSAQQREGLEKVEARFDERGPARLRLTAIHYDHFWTSEVRVVAQRHGEYEDYTVRQRHSHDPESFDFRATYRRNLNTGQVENFDYRPGPPQGMERVSELLHDRQSLAVMGVAGLVMGGAGYVVAGLPGMAVGAALGILGGGSFVAGNNLV
jgi:hypothetical protein